MQNNLLSVIKFLIILLLSGNAYSWSPFGPSNFNDCIIQNMKGVTSDSAAASIRLACRQKFPDKTPPAPPVDLSRAGYPRVDVWDKNYASISFENITTGKLQRTQYGSQFLSVTNKNNFDLTGIYIGILANKKQNSCSRSKLDYSEIIECTGNVDGNTTKNVSCGSIEGRWCLVGFKGAHQLNVDDFFSKLK